MGAVQTLQGMGYFLHSLSSGLMKGSQLHSGSEQAAGGRSSNYSKGRTEAQSGELKSPPGGVGTGSLF